MQQRLWHAFLKILRGPDSWAGRLGLAVGALALFVSVPARAVFYTVCPAGCSTTTITSALSLASATDTVVLESNITESVSLNSSIAGIQSSSSRAFTWVGNISQAALTLGTGLSQSVTLTGLVLDESGGMAPTVAVNSLGPGVSVTFINCQIQSSPAVNSGPLINAAGLSGGGTDSLVLDSCDLIGNAVLSGGLSADLNVLDALRVQNCVFQGFNAPNASCIALNTASTNTVARLWNNTFYGYGGYAVLLNTRGDLRNNLFAGGPTLPSGDVAWQASANPADAVTNAFADVTNTAGYGSGNLFGISASAECVSPASGDFHLVQGASCVDSGSNLSSLGVLVDKQGTPRPQGCCYDIGAFEFVPPPTATPTAIPTATATAIPTATQTVNPAGTPTPTPSPSPVFTPTPTTTPLPCVWVLTGSAVLPAGTYNLCSVTVQSGATLTIQGSVTLNLTGDFDVQSGGTVNGTGLGYAGGSNGQAGAGPGGGWGSVQTGYGGGGGGYGGTGGNDGISGSGGGATYGSLTAPADMGSGGGAGQSGVVPVAGGAGGAALIVYAPSGTVQVDGSILMDGAPGSPGSGSNSGGGGGGAGGSVYLQAQTLAGTGTISASGAQGGGAGTTGNTGVSGGGSGGGGRLDFCVSGTDVFAGALHANGSIGGVATSGTGNSSGGLSYGGTLEYCASSTGPRTSTPTRTVTRTHTPVPTQTITPTDSPVVTPSDTLTSTPTDSPVVTLSDTLTSTPTASPVVTLSDTLTSTPTDSPVVTPSDTLTSTPTASPVVTPSDTFTSTPTDSPVVTPSDTFTSTPTDSPVVTPSDTLTPSTTHSPVVTPLSTRTPSPSATPQIQPSPTATPPAPVVSPTDSPSPGPTATPVPQAVLSTNLFRPQGQGPLAISALVPRDGHVTVRIYDLTGERVSVAADENLSAGSWLQATWDGRNGQGQAVASGIYFISVRGGGLQSLLKVVVLR